jgi:GTP-binding protein YchF
MKIGLVGFPGCGKSTVFGALTGRRVETGYASRSSSAHLAVVKVPDPRVDALAELYSPKKITYAEIEFRDLPGGHDAELDRTSLNAMREVDALCQVLRGFESEAGDAPDALREIIDLEAETLLADLQVAEARVERLRKDRSNPRELALLERIQEALEAETPLRSMELGEEEQRLVAGYAFLTRKPLLLVLNVPEDDAALEIAEPIRVAAKERGLGLVSLSGPVEMDIAELPVAEQPEFLESLGLKEPASGRFVRAAFALIDLISMLTAGPDECRAWPIRRGTLAPKAAGRIHSDIERGFIRVEVTAFEDLIELGSEARCRDAGKLRVEGKEYEVCDGDVVHFRFNV